MATKTDGSHPPWPPLPSRPVRADLVAPATQIVRDREAYLGQGQHDIGRRIADDQVELFVNGEPALALQQQFDRLAPEFVALHDVGTSATLRLLGALAGAAGARVQRLSIRRQGLGVALAVLQFVEIPLASGENLRVYSTDVNADTQSRHQIAMVLLGRSKLGVLMVRELPPHALTAALQPLRDALMRGSWPNRDMLLLPLGSATTLAAQVAHLSGSSGVAIRVTPQAARPNDAWSFISGTWNRLHGVDQTGAALNTELNRAVPRPPVPRPEAPTQHMELTPEPPYPAAQAPTNARWADYAQRCAALKGVSACCIFDFVSQRALAHVGTKVTPDRLADQGRLLLDSMADAARSLNLGHEVPEASISFGQNHLLLRPIAGHPGVIVHLVIESTPNNLTLARIQLDRVPTPPPGR
ncbi:MAG: hypothetical protein KGI35_06525 [Burkholderiales bacterium]|nr:hypothetical protein [Burkholderiales bacterium]